MTDLSDTSITTLGDRKVRSPLTLSTIYGDGVGNFIPDEARVRFQVDVGTGMDNPDICFEKAGPRERVFFDPSQVRAAIVTCGGLCPGLNNVIRSIFLELHYNYGAGEVLGIRYGYQGLNPDAGEEPVRITPEFVDDIHMEGGTVLGSSRGAQPTPKIVDFLVEKKIDMLFCIGGDGTQRGAHDIALEVLKRKLPISVLGIPKTIDNDILYVKRSFGFVTAIDQAQDVLFCAHNEAKGAPNGIGLVKVMGRQSGFIAAGATLASQEVNFCLIPELPFPMEGETGFLNVLKQRMLARKHAVIVVAEGAGQDLIGQEDIHKDASGNILFADIGIHLKHAIKEYFNRERIPVNVKYIDPSYIIRSVPANSADAFLCDQYGRHAVHAAMSGKTDMIIGEWNDSFMHVPSSLATAGRKRLEPESELWGGVVAATGQPRVWGK